MEIVIRKGNTLLIWGQKEGGKKKEERNLEAETYSGGKKKRKKKKEYMEEIHVGERNVGNEKPFSVKKKNDQPFPCFLRNNHETERKSIQKRGGILKDTLRGKKEGKRGKEKALLLKERGKNHLLKTLVKKTRLFWGPNHRRSRGSLSRRLKKKDEEEGDGTKSSKRRETGLPRLTKVT